MVRSTCVVLGLAAGIAHAHVGDVGLAITAGRIVTGEVENHGGAQIVHPGTRVFGGELGLTLPGFGDEPGFFASEGTLIPGSTLGFNVRAALRKWNGNGFDVSSERMSLEHPSGSPSLLTPLTDPGTPLAAFGFIVPATGDFDDHPNYIIVGRTGPGIYLLEIEFTSGMPAVTTSLPTWLVLNDGMDEPKHDAAIAWVEENIVPAPGVSAILTMTLLCAMRRRR